MNWDFDTKKTRIKLTPANDAEAQLLLRIIKEGYKDVTITYISGPKGEVVSLILWKSQEGNIR